MREEPTGTTRLPPPPTIERAMVGVPAGLTTMGTETAVVVTLFESVTRADKLGAPAVVGVHAML